MKKNIPLIAVLLILVFFSEAQLVRVDYPDVGYTSGTSDFSFFDEQNGYLGIVYATTGSIHTPYAVSFFKTVNGGADWIEINTWETGNDPIEHLLYVVGSDIENNGYLGFMIDTYSDFLKYDNLSGSFHSLSTCTWENVIKISASQDNELFVLSNDHWGFGSDSNRLYRLTPDDELDLLQVYSRGDTVMGDVFFIDMMNGFMTAKTGGDWHIFKTTDGGDSFQSVYVNDSLGFRDIHFTSGKVGFVSSNGHLIRTSDEGHNWELTTLCPDTAIYSFSFIDEQTGYCAGDEGVIFKTSDGGLSWIRQPLEEKISIRKMIMFSEVSGYIGNNSKLYRYLPGSQVEEGSIPGISIGPNPASSTITVHFPVYLGSSGYSLKIYSINGLMIKDVFVPKGTSRLDIDVSGIPAGLYLAVLKNEELVASTVKFVVTK